MTEMSERRCAREGANARKPSRSLGGFHLARGVHEPCPLVVLALLPLFLVPAGCIIPPSLSSGDKDAGVNSPPSITAVRTDADNLFEPGPVSLTQGSGMMNFDLLDTDLGDTLQVRVFVNYRIDDPTPPRTQCTAAPTGSPKRTVTCSAGTVCQKDDAGKTDLDLQVVVFDRALVDGKPDFQATAEGGWSTSRFFYLTCAEATP